ncbi:MAG: hypothetical protein Ct9H300mP11_27260 [Chloroflexota bacterium]|nr:MAG: hypothetical protein Ct9H300mP11_27260 [Chloroflexota bacterium]
MTDGRSHEIRKFSKSGEFLASWGGQGTNNGEFNGPWGITTDSEGNVYVADHLNHRVKSSHPLVRGLPKSVDQVPIEANCTCLPVLQ